MRQRKIPMPERLFIAAGLLLTTLPLLFREYIHIPDFVRGCLPGIGLGLEFYGFIRLKKRRGGYTACDKVKTEV